MNKQIRVIRNFINPLGAKTYFTKGDKINISRETALFYVGDMSHGEEKFRKSQEGTYYEVTDVDGRWCSDVL